MNQQAVAVKQFAGILCRLHSVNVDATRILSKHLAHTCCNQMFKNKIYIYSPCSCNHLSPLQAHMGRLPLPVSDYVTDTRSVLDNSLRILQAMLDVAADAGWLVTVLNTINLVQVRQSKGRTRTAVLAALLAKSAAIA